MRSIKEIRASVTPISDAFKAGDYVFACKWQDAAPKDRWIVGIVKEVCLNLGNGKAGLFFEESGQYHYKYAVKITAEEGKKILRYWLNTFS